MLNNNKKIRMVKRNYDNSKIYKIINPNNKDKVYIGATTMNLDDRLKLHLNHYKRHLDAKVTYKSTVFDIIKEEGYTIELIENYPCKNIEELNQRETYYINNTDNCINKRSKLIDESVKKDNNKKKYLNNIEKFKEYYKNNKERIKNKYSERKLEKYHCFCCNVTILSLAKNKHLNTKKHIIVIKALEDIISKTTD